GRQAARGAPAVPARIRCLGLPRRHGRGRRRRCPATPDRGAGGPGPRRGRPGGRGGRPRRLPRRARGGGPPHHAGHGRPRPARPLGARAAGALAPGVAEDVHGRFRAALAVPAPPTTPVTVDGGRLRLEFDGVRAALPLPALLARCTLVDSTYDDHRGVVVVGFAPDPDLWPSHLVPAGSTRQPG